MNNKHGFVLIELIIAFIIIGILAIIAVQSYRGYVKRSMASEAEVLAGEINTAEQVYYVENQKYYAGTVGEEYGASFGVDPRTNKYFTSYYISDQDIDNEKGTYIAKIKYKDKDVVTVIGSLSAVPTIIDNFTSDSSSN